MTSTAWTKCGLVAAIGAFAMPIIIAGRDLSGVRRELTQHPAFSWFTAVLVIASLAIQGACILKLARGKPNAPLFGRRVAIIHALVALGIFFLAAAAKPIADSGLFATWFSGWFGPDSFGSRSALLSLLPWFLLAQWVSLKLADHEPSPREVFRGLVIGCLTTCALLGVWTFSPQFFPSSNWRLFSDGTSTFFNIGVTIHLIAIWQVAVRSRADWAWAGLVGFGCLGVGFALTRSYSMGHENPGSQVIPDQTVGAVLYAGWYELSPYLPPIAYGLAAVASVVLYRTRAVSAKAPAPEVPAESLDDAPLARPSLITAG